MKQKNPILATLTIALVFTALALIACDNDDNGKDKETPHVPDPAIIDNTNGLAFTGKVTIKTSDLYTAAEWDAVVANVVAALNAAYEAAEMTLFFDNVFGGNGLEVILVNNLTKDWEVKTGTTQGTLYIKTGSVNSITATSYETAILSLAANNPVTS